MIKLKLPELGVIYLEINQDLPLWIIVAGFWLAEEEVSPMKLEMLKSLPVEKWPMEVRLLIAQGASEEEIKKVTVFEKEPVFVHAVKLSSFLSQANMMLQIDGMDIDKMLDAE